MSPPPPPASTARLDKEVGQHAHQAHHPTSRLPSHGEHDYEHFYTLYSIVQTTPFLRLASLTTPPTHHHHQHPHTAPQTRHTHPLTYGKHDDSYFGAQYAIAPSISTAPYLARHCCVASTAASSLGSIMRTPDADKFLISTLAVSSAAYLTDTSVSPNLSSKCGRIAITYGSKSRPTRSHNVSVIRRAPSLAEEGPLAALMWV